MLRSTIARAAQARKQVIHAQYPYFVPRTSSHNLPVYSDVKNNGARYILLIQGIQGNADDLARDLRDELCERSSPENDRLHIQVVRSDRLVITGAGGRWDLRDKVVQWLKGKGF